MESQSITVNGLTHPWKRGWTVSGLLKDLEIPFAGTAVERNREIVRRADHATTEIQPGDRFEIVRLVGGG